MRSREPFFFRSSEFEPQLLKTAKIERYTAANARCTVCQLALSCQTRCATSETENHTIARNEIHSIFIISYEKTSAITAAVCVCFMCMLCYNFSSFVDGDVMPRSV
jgi:hypothetical protein